MLQRDESSPVLMELEALIEPVLADLGLNLYDVEQVRERGREILRVTVERPEGREKGHGVTIDEIVEASRELSTVLDLEDPLESTYHLEVQSPGVERKLRRRRHFDLSQGERLHVVFNQVRDRQTAVDGTLTSVSDEGIVVETDRGDAVNVPFPVIKSAETVFDWSKPKPGGPKRKNKKRKKR